jgi:hypothetical protein
MPHDPRHPDPAPEQPRSEPEIIPPDRSHPEGRPEGARTGRDGVWFRFDEGNGATRRVFVAPGWPTILLALLAAGVVAALGLLLLAGLVLIWIPVLVGGVLLALVSRSVRQRLAGLRRWWSRA